MYVYVLTVVWQCDSGECGSHTKVFQSVEDALKEMKAEMNTARADFNGLDTEETEYADGDMGWSIWEAGEYCYNHIDITVQECYVW